MVKFKNHSNIFWRKKGEKHSWSPGYIGSIDGQMVELYKDQYEYENRGWGIYSSYWYSKSELEIKPRTANDNEETK